MGYVDEVLELVSKKNADQPEFLQAVTEVSEYSSTTLSDLTRVV